MQFNDIKKIVRGIKNIIQKRIQAASQKVFSQKDRLVIFIKIHKFIIKEALKQGFWYIRRKFFSLTGRIVRFIKVQKWSIKSVIIFILKVVVVCFILFICLV